ncbi:hypothetical protein RHO14_09540 [Orbus wheelerorum]|uniref:hypothetical protein n=1 Tax=Orbus wheelerorum TaxID=3074111 RepID=UPI00370D7547
MTKLVGGTITRISLASLIFFIIILVCNIYFHSENGILKPIIQSLIATLIYTVFFVVLKKIEK